MSATKVEFIAQCDDGPRPIDAWAVSRDGELVAHRFIMVGGEEGADWVISHRRSGLALSTVRLTFKTKGAALAAIQKLEKLPEWKAIQPSKNPAKPKGLSKRERIALGQLVVSIVEAA